MKISCLIIFALLPIAFSKEAEAEAKNDIDDTPRIKRAGFSLIGGALQNLQKSAFSASSSLSSGSSSSSSSASASSSPHQDQGHSYHSHEYHVEEPHYEQHGGQHQDTKSFDGWELKQSIVNTLLQAVKAIAGGITTLNGQLIKGSGYLVTQKGKLIQQGGDAVSSAGKNIIQNAHLVKPDTSGHGGSYGGPSFGHSLGASFSGLSSGLTKSITSLSAGSAGSVASLSTNAIGGLSSGSANAIGGLSKGSSSAVAGLSSGSANSVTSLSSSSSASSSSSSSSSHGHGHSSSEAKPDAYAPIEGPSYSYNIPEINNNYGGYPEEVKPANTVGSYGPPKPTISYHQEQPQQSYGTPDFSGHFGKRMIVVE